MQTDEDIDENIVKRVINQHVRCMYHFLEFAFYWYSCK